MGAEPRVPSRPLVRFKLLGSVEAEVDGGLADLGSPRERRLLTALLSAKGRPVLRNVLVDWVWDDLPKDPGQALNEVVSNLRTKRLKPIGLGDALINGGGTYLLKVPVEWVDVHRFHTLLDRAAQLDGNEARDLLYAAVQLGSTTPLAGIDGRKIDAYRERLAADYRNAQIRFCAIEVGAGRVLERIPQLESLFREMPDDALVTWIYMSGLHNVGRTDRALGVYGEHRRQVIELGLEVAPQVSQLQTRLLREIPALPYNYPEETMSDTTTDHDEDTAPEADEESKPNVVTHVGAVHSENVVFGIQYQRR
ncbi:hypothetical protein GCM10027088_01870 [Nocardia goodfellowii]